MRIPKVLILKVQRVVLSDIVQLSYMQNYGWEGMLSSSCLVYIFILSVVRFKSIFSDRHRNRSPVAGPSHRPDETAQRNDSRWGVDGSRDNIVALIICH